MSKDSFLYDDLFKALENRTFEVVVPETYTPAISKFCLENNVEPLDSCEYGESITYISVAKIVDLVFLGVPFSLTDPADFSEIVFILGEYIKTVREVTINCPSVLSEVSIELKQFINRCPAAYEKLEYFVPKDAKLPTPKTLLDLVEPFI